MDITKLPIAELRRLNKRIEVELKKRDESAKRDLLKKMQRLAAEHGLSLDDVVGATAPQAKPGKAAPKAPAKPKGKKIVVAPKYRNPDDTSMTWTGRGRKPLWVQKWLDDGKAIDDLLIK